MLKEENIIRGCAVYGGPMNGWGCGFRRVVTRLVNCPTPTPTPTPTPEPPPAPGCVRPNSSGSCPSGTLPNGTGWCCLDNGGTQCQYGERRDCNNCNDGFDNDGDSDIDYDDVGCLTSPIIIDLTGNGFRLTNSQNGVSFDLDAKNGAEQTAWTKAVSDDVFLALDRNENGAIDSGRELFGDVTPQPTSNEPNGFLALAVFDKTANGGNNDNQIDARDSVFARLKLWRDGNHNGVSEAGELSNLSASEIRTIELNYHESRRTDEHGNRFVYRAKVRDAQGAQVGRWAWDVFFKQNQ